MVLNLAIFFYKVADTTPNTKIVICNYSVKPINPLTAGAAYTRVFIFY